MKTAAGSLLFAAALCVMRSAGAVDPFEIQVYDGTANHPGQFGLELHLNRVSHGTDQTNPPELPPSGQTHFTLEPSFGVTPFWEIGGYLQMALLDGGAFDYAGVKLRSKFVTPPGSLGHVRLGVNLELSRLPVIFDQNRWGGEVRPIAAFEDAAWLFVINPIVGTPLAGPGLHAGPTFEPAGMAKRKFAEIFALGFEYYADLGAISSLHAPAAQEHYLYEAFDLLSVHNLELNLGVGEGLTRASNPLVVKMILGYSFGD